MTEQTRPRQRKGFFRNADVPRTRIAIGSLIVLFPVLGVFLGVLGVASHDINGQYGTYSCTVTNISADAPLRDGNPAWKVVTSCGGTLYIDPDATHQTSQQATALARSMSPGHRYALTIQGVLRNPFAISSYLLAASPRA